jgi:hypothetical protein
MSSRLRIAEHASYPVGPESDDLLHADLERLAGVLATITIAAPRQAGKRDLHASTVRTRLDAAFEKHLGADTGVEIVLPYHPDHLDVRPTTLHLDAVAGQHAYHYALRRYEGPIYTATTGWPIARTRTGITAGTLITPTPAFSSRILGYPSPFPRYAAILNLARNAGVLTMPILLVGIEPDS